MFDRTTKSKNGYVFGQRAELQQHYGSCNVVRNSREIHTITIFLKKIFRNANLKIHSYQFSKRGFGVVFLKIRFVLISVFLDEYIQLSLFGKKLMRDPYFSLFWGIRNLSNSSVKRRFHSNKQEKKMKIVCFRGLEFYLAYSFHQFLPNQNLQIVLENMSQKTDVKKIFRSMTKNNFFLKIKKRLYEFTNFTITEVHAFLYPLLFKKNGSFFLNWLFTSHLQKMRSKLDRKLQSKFLLFFKNLLVHISKKNAVNIQGLKIKVKGKIHGALRTKTWIASVGNLSLQSFQANVDFSYLPCQTVFGIFGVKVWINYD